MFFVAYKFSFLSHLYSLLLSGPGTAGIIHIQRVFGWYGLFTVYAEKHCLYYNVVREKHCSGLGEKKQNKPANWVRPRISPSSTPPALHHYIRAKLGTVTE